MSTTTPSPAPRKRYRKPVGPGLKKLLYVVFALFAVMGVNSVYLVSVTLLEYLHKQTYQNYFYQIMFLIHLVLGVLIILPFIAFGIKHIFNTYNRPNKRAVRAGYALFATSLILLGSGIVLTRIDGILVVKDQTARSIAYWAHVISPLVVVWLFILHRLAGRRIHWKAGVAWAAVAAGFAIVMTLMHSQDPRKWNVAGPESGEQYFFPSLSRTSTGNFIPADTLMMDEYCKECHADVHEQWAHSVHRFSSFNNEVYEMSVLNTRKAMFERDGNVQGSRFCAGCHDPVPFFSGAFDDPKFDDPEYDLASDSMAQAGITCTTCHAITNINSPKGNADYTIEEPIHYPFAFSDNEVLKWVNRQLVKAKPAFHKKTFLKPLHQSPEFCGSCHKVHLPPELNAYKWLRGQNHYDPFLLSGVSGHGITSFYYPPKAETNCNGCHMPLNESTDFAARDFDGSGVNKIHNHMFPSANTAIPFLKGMPDWVNDAHREFNEGVMRVDVFGVREGETVDSPLVAPLRPEVPELVPGRTYLLETVIRTVKMGHLFTQGTADSNEVWLDVTLKSGDRVLGRSGGMSEETREVDPWSHFVNAFVLDREGRRIDRRNAEDIFIALYNHQIPPGAGQTVHYMFDVPEGLTEPLEAEVKLLYRKFDTTIMHHVDPVKYRKNPLPIMTLASDRVVFPVQGTTQPVAAQPAPDFPLWQRWNDYGIGMLLKGKGGELRQAEEAFAEVEELGRPDGPLNRARVYLTEGRLNDAVRALEQAADHDPPAPAWSVAWFTGLANKQNGYFNEAIANFKAILDMDTEETRTRDFDFSLDYRLLNELGQTVFERAKQERGPERADQRSALLMEARDWFHEALAIDPENETSHFNLALIYAQLGDSERSDTHRALHAKYHVDDNAKDRAVAAARIRYPAANHAAETIVIYDLQREGAYELPAQTEEMVRHD